MTDPFSLFWTGGELSAATISLLVNTFAKPFVEAAKGKWQDHTERARWEDSLRSYGESILRNYGRLRVLGKNEDVPLGSVFTDVYLLDEVSARRRFDIRELMKEPVDRFDLPQQQAERRNGMGLVNQGQSLYILGKPGAGKTTFLKNVAVRAIANQLGSPNQQRLPLFVSLHEWANSRHNELMPFLVGQLDIHHFPNAEEFLKYQLVQGKCLLLCDGLDEVRREPDQRVQLEQQLQDFIRKHNFVKEFGSSKKQDHNQLLITCRVAASEYVFSGLRDVEVADFTRDQVLQYAKKWFGSDIRKFQGFAADLQKPENAGLADLCKVPLLLSLLCLYYDDAQSFPQRRVELYEEALDTLLRKWDKSRDIQRDEIYKSLSHKRKQQMFAHIAKPAFEMGQLYFTTKRLATDISHYLSNLPGAPSAEEIDGEAILRAIEAQHGVLVERAQNIHSFSHLTFQEYFTAYHIVDNEARGVATRLAQMHLTDQRWREVFLLTAGLLDNAGDFAKEMCRAVDELVRDGWLAKTLMWADAKTQAMGKQDAGRFAEVRLAYSILALDLARARARAPALNLVLSFVRDLAVALSDSLSDSQPLDFVLDISLTFDIALVRVAARERKKSFSHALSRALTLSRSLAQTFHPEVGVDYALYYAWAIADLLAHMHISDTREERMAFLRDFSALTNFCREMGVVDAATALSDMALPSRESDNSSWRTLADSEWKFLNEERGFLPPPELSQSEYKQVNDYLYANELLVRCLELAYVTNRKEILNGLLRPPG